MSRENLLGVGFSPLAAEQLVFDWTTTEQEYPMLYQGSQCYAKLVDFGAMPNATQKSVSSGATADKVIALWGFFEQTSSPTTMYPLSHPETTAANITRLRYDLANDEVDIDTDFDWSTYSAIVFMIYTKA